MVPRAQLSRNTTGASAEVVAVSLVIDRLSVCQAETIRPLEDSSWFNVPLQPVTVMFCESVTFAMMVN